MPETGLFNRIKTNIEGLDDLIGGGFPENYSVLITGYAGSGKSIFTEQVMCNLANDGQNVLYISYEQEAEQLRLISDIFGWNVRQLEKEGKFHFMEGNVYNISETIEEINKLVKQYDIKTVAIDSIASLTCHIDEKELKEQLYLFIKYFRKENVLAFLITEISPDSEWLSRDKYSEFVVDCIVKLNSIEGEEEDFRTINIPKMRLTKQKTGIYSMKIDERGIKIIS